MPDAPLQSSLFEEDYLLRELGQVAHVPQVALTELVANAWDAGASKVEITIPTQPGDELTVEDDGCGMPPEILRRIFEPYFTTRRGRGGTGLGLHICESVVSRVLGGTIAVNSRVGEGSAFTLRLPRVAPRRDERGDGAGYDADRNQRNQRPGGV